MTSANNFFFFFFFFFFLQIHNSFFSFYSAQLKVFIEGLFSFNQDIPAFKEHLRDFLVQIRVCMICVFAVDIFFAQLNV